MMINIIIKKEMTTIIKNQHNTTLTIVIPMLTRKTLIPLEFINRSIKINKKTIRTSQLIPVKDTIRTLKGKISTALMTDITNEKEKTNPITWKIFHHKIFNILL